MMIGDSRIRAIAMAIPKAARLIFASSSLATIAVRKGCSAAIIIHVDARGSQKIKMVFKLLLFVFCMYLLSILIYERCFVGAIPMWLPVFLLNKTRAGTVALPLHKYVFIFFIYKCFFRTSNTSGTSSPIFFRCSIFGIPSFVQPLLS